MIRIFALTALVLAAVLWSVRTLAEDAPSAATADAPEWIQEDIEAGYTESVLTGKPLLVTFR